MHLLLIDPNPETARRLHSEFLGYRGMNWSLSHCVDTKSAVEMLAQDSFQTVLLSDACPYEQTLLAIRELLGSENCPPLISLGQAFSKQEQLKLIEDGSDDCFSHTEIDGVGVMRHLRVAELRSSVVAEQASRLLHGDLHGFDAENYLQTHATNIGDPTRRFGKRKLRIAHIASRESLLDWAVFENEGHAIEHYNDIQETVAVLDHRFGEFDALVIEQSVFEQSGDSDENKLEEYLALIPGIVLTLERSDYSALSYIEQGYSNCLVVDETSATSLLMAIEKAVIRRRRDLLKSFADTPLADDNADRRKSLRQSLDRRRHVRFNVDLQIAAYPILPSGAPDLSGCCDAYVTSISVGGVSVTLPQTQHLPRRNWLLGVQQANGKAGFISCFLRDVEYQKNLLHAGLVFQNSTSDFFRNENLQPTFDATSGTFATNVSCNVLDEWVNANVLTKQLVRRARTCPQCSGVCSVGTGCSQCGEFDLRFEELVHHFACAYVDKSTAFDKGGSIKCPKCLCDNLVAGADFEIFRSHYQCQCCDHQGEATADVGCCLNCQLRFPLEMAPEIEVYGYDVERLDVLAIVDAARQSVAADSAAADL